MELAIAREERKYEVEAIEEVRKLSDKELILRILNSSGLERCQYVGGFKINILEMAMKIDSFGGVTKGRQRKTLENYHLSIRYGINCKKHGLWGNIYV